MTIDELIDRLLNIRQSFDAQGSEVFVRVELKRPQVHAHELAANEVTFSRGSKTVTIMHEREA